MEPIRADHIGIAALIYAQRKLAKSGRPFERVVGVLYLAGLLSDRLTLLTDRQVGQLMFDFAWDELSVLDPAAVICQHATQRLSRSSAGHFTVEDIERQERPHCPRCGNEMLFRFGISEPDFYECTLLACRHKQLLDTTTGEHR